MLAAATPADGQEKKDPGLKAPFDQYVKVEGKDAKGEAFVKEGVPGHLYTTPTGAKAWWVPETAIGSSWGGLRSVVVTDKDGKKHDCGKAFRGSNLRLIFPVTMPKS